MCEGVGVSQLLLVLVAECPGDLLEEDSDCSSPSHIVQRTASRVQFTCTRVRTHTHTHTCIQCTYCWFHPQPNRGDVFIKVAICAKCARYSAELTPTPIHFDLLLRTAYMTVRVVLTYCTMQFNIQFVRA